MLQPRIEIIKDKKLVGKSILMSLAEDHTQALWKNFMPLRKQIKNVLSPDLYCVRVYEAHYFEKFNLENTFYKWAAIEVKDLDEVNDELQPLLLKEGLYAVFIHKGSGEDHSIYNYIFGEWIPQSPYQIDHRPHFDVLSEKYKNHDPTSEEEIWIPIKTK